MEARGPVPFCQSLTMEPLTQPPTLLFPPRCSSISLLEYFCLHFNLMFAFFFFNSKFKRKMCTQLTVSLKTQAEIIFTRFSGCLFLYHVCLTIQLDHLLIVAIETRQPLMDPSVHVNPIFFFFFLSCTCQRSSVCKLYRARQM